MLATRCPKMELVRNGLKIGIGVISYIAENEIGNRFDTLWEVTIGWKGGNMAGSERSVKFGKGI